MLTEAKNVLAIFGFLVATICCVISFTVGSPLSLFAPKVWRAWMDLYKGAFNSLLIGLVAITSPTKVRLYSKHENMGFRVDRNGQLKSTLSPRAVVTVNHQIYSDWVFVWWLAYTAGLETAPIMTLKKSLQKVPLLGWCMTCLRFLFLSRHWVDDEKFILETTNFMAEDRSWPLWLSLFPEGTVFNKNTQAKGETYANNAHIERSLIPKHLLLPRVKGLQAILRGLQKSVPVLYDITLVYEPQFPSDVAAENFFSLKRSFLEGLGPSSVKLHIREIPISQIPYLESEEIFTQWLYQRWLEKDAIYEQLSSGDLEHEFRSEAPVRPNSWFELYKCFQIIVVALVLVRLVLQLF